MRFDGTLKKWNAERGFGFVAPSQGGQEMFVHVSAFPRDGRVPAVGELLSFEEELDRDGKKRAVRVQRPRSVTPPRPSHTRTREGRASPPVHRRSKLGSNLIALGLVVAIGWFAYTRVEPRLPMKLVGNQSEPVLATHEAAPVGAFRCDGRTYCSQMTSCAEAKYFLRNCPDTKMDGNHDGVPCQQQWCTGSFY